MIFQSDKMTLVSVMDVYKGKVNDIYVCVDTTNGRNNYYTVLVVNDHEVVKKILEIMEKAPDPDEACVDMFSFQNSFCIVFDYVKERSPEEFFTGGTNVVQTSMDIGLNLVVQCMGSKLPYPFLSLVLEQGQIQLLRDNSIALSYAIDLEGIDESANESTCAMQCAILLRDFFKTKVPRKNISYKLLIKKIPKKSYHEFREIYKDLQLSATRIGKLSLRARFKNFLGRNGHTLFKTFLVIAIILTCIALPMFVSKVVWGDIPFLRVFYNSFKTIGTETLLK